MKKCSIGDIVRVVDYGETYPTYTDLFNQVVEQNNLIGSIKHAFQFNPTEGDIYVVVAITEHIERNDRVALISNDNQTGTLIGFDGVELV